MANGCLVALVVEGILIFCLALVVLAHSRLLGLLHMRVGPAGAKPLADGPATGTKLSELSATLLDEKPWRVSFPRPVDLLLIFVSPQCETCNALIPHVKDFARLGGTAEIMLVSTI